MAAANLTRVLGQLAGEGSMQRQLIQLQRTAVRLLERRWLRSAVTAIDDSHPQDVFVAGYPKSGNTWVQHLLAALHAGCDLRRASDAVVQLLVPDVHATRYYQRWTTPMIFKTHELPHPRFRRVIFLVRDGRDAMVSYYHYNRATMAKPVSLHDMVIEGRGLFPSRWHEHTEAWSRNPFAAEILTVRYEDLRADAVSQLRRVATFLGHDDVRDEVLENIADAAKFERMQEREQKFGWADKNWSKEHKFVRRGVVGSYADEMPANLVQAFESDAAPWLRAYGYAVEATSNRT